MESPVYNYKFPLLHPTCTLCLMTECIGFTFKQVRLLFLCFCGFNLCPQTVARLQVPCLSAYLSASAATVNLCFLVLQGPLPPFSSFLEMWQSNVTIQAVFLSQRISTMSLGFLAMIIILNFNNDTLHLQWPFHLMILHASLSFITSLGKDELSSFLQSDKLNHRG